MGDLANYSIETDHTVLLSFKDGRRLRVPLGQLSSHLKPADLEKIKRAVKLRREFIRHHMPKTLVVFIAVTLFALSLFAGSRAVAWLFRPATPEPLPNDTQMVRDTHSTTLPLTTPHPITSGGAPLAVVDHPPTPAPGQMTVKTGTPKPVTKLSMTVSGLITGIIGPVKLPASTPLPTVLPIETPPLESGEPAQTPLEPTTETPPGPNTTPTPEPIPSPTASPAPSDPETPTPDEFTESPGLTY